MSAPEHLAFDDHREDGAFLVHGPDGVVARIEVGVWNGRSFTATTPDGVPLCSGRSRGIFSTWWDAVDPAGAPLVSLRRSGWGGSRTRVDLGGRAMTLHGSFSGRQWRLEDEREEVVLSSETTTGFFTFRPHAWEVQRHRDPLTLAQVVAVVQLFRLSQKAQAAAAAAQ